MPVPVPVGTGLVSKTPSAELGLNVGKGAYTGGLCRRRVQPWRSKKGRAKAVLNSKKNDTTPLMLRPAIVYDPFGGYQWKWLWSERIQ